MMPSRDLMLAAGEIHLLIILWMKMDVAKYRGRG